ncbi:MAG: 2-succinyl-5-enolpyruvyl-6-hydroxy-3-cyclohexene-1-carboxylic-acid synthase [Bifidobacteriaceae bacterium]|nr:2-succinyl-5-enolpyruvyl-6-hydroxy-3-cyclohexene-1-carboxylic-acid synthase [Bifidobacteriaceae bacterium]
MSAAVAAARALLEAAVAAGLRRVVFAPGSRGAPLVYAAVEAASRGELELTVRTDERVAAFTALGFAAATGEPAAVVTTSGTAVANLHPAVMEAAASRWPLLVITADRPAELHGIGANQTVDQRGVFGAAPVWQTTLPAGADPASCRRAAAQAIAAALGLRSGLGGPAHINLQFREPLVPAAWPLAQAAEAPSWSSGDDRRDTSAPKMSRPRSAAVVSHHGEEMLGVDLAGGPRTVVIAGYRAGSQARELAEQAGWPLLAEPGSGSWGGPNAITAGRLALGLLGDQIERAVVYGRPVLSRPVAQLIQSPRIETVIIHHGGGAWFDLGRRAGRVASGATVDQAPSPEDLAWLEAWRQTGRAVWASLQTLPYPNGPAVAAIVARATVGGEEPPKARRSEHPDEPSSPAARAAPPTGVRVSAGREPAVLVVGASSAIRDLDLAPAPPADIRVLTMRGLAGIDGTVSFAGGVALARNQPVTVLLGDLALAHDAGGLAIPVHERRPDLRIVVLADGGGAIFENLEVARPDLEPAFERFFATPVNLNLAALAAAYGASFEQARSADALAACLSQSVNGINLVGVPLERSHRRGLETEIVELSRNAQGLPGNFPAVREDSPRMRRFDSG